MRSLPFGEDAREGRMNRKPTMHRSLLCYAHGRDGEWQGICFDLDIAVQGRSFDEVKNALERSIRTYVESASKEAPAVRARLLRRRAPVWMRMRAFARLMVAAIRHRNGDDESRVGFTVPCPA